MTSRGGRGAIQSEDEESTRGAGAKTGALVDDIESNLVVRRSF